MSGVHTHQIYSTYAISMANITLKTKPTTTLTFRQMEGHFVVVSATLLREQQFWGQSVEQDVLQCVGHTAAASFSGGRASGGRYSLRIIQQRLGQVVKHDFRQENGHKLSPQHFWGQSTPHFDLHSEGQWLEKELESVCGPKYEGDFGKQHWPGQFSVQRFLHVCGHPSIPG